MSRLIGLEPDRRAASQSQVPNLVTPEDWRQFITARVVWRVGRTPGLENARLMHSSISHGTHSKEVAESVPMTCYPAVHTVDCVFQAAPEDTPPLFLRVSTGALCLAIMGYDQTALTDAVDKNTDSAIRVWRDAHAAAGLDAVNSAKRGLN